MKAFTHLLAATDFSATATCAEARAALLAAEHGARLTLLHSISGLALKSLRSHIVQGFAQTKAQLIQYYEDTLKLRAEALAQHWNIEVSAVCVVGQAHREITRVVQESGAEMLILGALGEHPAREFLLGTTAERAIRESVVPVLVVRNMPSAAYRRVLVTLDLSEHSQSVVTLARRAAPKAWITLAHAFEVPFEGKLHYAGVAEADIARYLQHERQAALDALHALSLSIERDNADIRVEHGIAQDVIPNILKETKVELVVAGKRGRSELVDLFLGSTTKHLLLEAPCDVLVVPPSVR